MTASYILVVEDEPRISEVVIAYLHHAGHKTRLIETGDRVLACIEKEVPLLLVLDVMLPGVDGVTLCNQIRRKYNFPIIMVTARVEEIDRLLGFEVGADDYLCKPFSPGELVARVNALLRRSQGQMQSSEDPIFSNDVQAQRIYCKGNHLDLTPQEYKLLSVFIASPSRVFSRAQLLELAFSMDSDIYDRTIDSHIKNIRKRIKPYFENVDIIQSVYGVGYRCEWNKASH